MRKMKKKKRQTNIICYKYYVKIQAQVNKPVSIFIPKTISEHSKK